VRERIAAGDGDSQVIDFLVARYGEFVLLKPRFAPHTWLLWLVPPLARDLRLLVRERIAAGDGDSQVIDFLVARYGEFVLLKPRFAPHTWLLWLVPPLALLGGGAALWRYSRRRKDSVEAPDPSAVELTAEEEARLERLMEVQPGPDPVT
jgi:cytochrome c-type biogenesis protein CcmH/NrfF